MKHQEPGSDSFLVGLKLYTKFRIQFVHLSNETLKVTEPSLELLICFSYHCNAAATTRTVVEIRVRLTGRAG